MPFITPDWIFDKLLPSSIGAGGALTVFYLTTRRDKKKENLKKSNEILDKVTYLKSLIDTVILDTKILSGNIDKYFEGVQNNKLAPALMVFTPFTDYVRAIDAFSKEEYYSAFVKYYKKRDNSAKTFNNLISYIDYIYAELLQIQGMIQKTQSFDYEQKVEYQKIVDPSVDACEQFVVENRAHGMKLVPQLESLIINFRDNLKDQYDLRYFQLHFVIPVRNLLLFEINSNQIVAANQVVLNLANKLRKAAYLFELIQESNDKNSKDIKSIGDNMKRSLKHLIDKRAMLT